MTHTILEIHYRKKEDEHGKVRHVIVPDLDPSEILTILRQPAEVAADVDDRG